MADDGFGIDVGDIPIPPTQSGKPEITDRFDYNVAFELAFVGVGQCGGRLAATFDELGYGRVCAINTTVQDLAELKLPEERKLDIGQARGAGKDPQMAAELFKGHDEDVFDLFKRNWGEEIDYSFVCFAAAGGTGAGGHPSVINVARRYMKSLKRPEKVGAIIALPKDDEGQQFAKNALHTAKGLKKLGLSPIIFIDNQKIRDMYDPPATREHAIENQATAKLLHMFNRLAGSDSEHTTFDRADLAKLLDSGVITFAADNITKWGNAADISTPIRDQLHKNMLATMNLSKSSVAGLIYVLNGTAWDEVKAADLDHGTAMFTRILDKNSTVFPGVYRGSSDGGSITVLAMIGSLPWPRERLMELADEAGTPRDAVAKQLGV